MELGKLTPIFQARRVDSIAHGCQVNYRTACRGRQVLGGEECHKVSIQRMTTPCYQGESNTH